MTLTSSHLSSHLSSHARESIMTRTYVDSVRMGEDKWQPRHIHARAHTRPRPRGGALTQTGSHNLTSSHR